MEKIGSERRTNLSILTDEITKSMGGLTTKEYKNLKELKKD